MSSGELNWLINSQKRDGIKLTDSALMRLTAVLVLIVALFNLSWSFALGVPGFQIESPGNLINILLALVALFLTFSTLFTTVLARYQVPLLLLTLGIAGQVQLHASANPIATYSLLLSAFIPFLAIFSRGIWLWIVIALHVVTGGQQIVEYWSYPEIVDRIIRGMALGVFGGVVANGWKLQGDGVKPDSQKIAAIAFLVISPFPILMAARYGQISNSDPAFMQDAFLGAVVLIGSGAVLWTTKRRQPVINWLVVSLIFIGNLISIFATEGVALPLLFLVVLIAFTLLDRVNALVVSLVASTIPMLMSRLDSVSIASDELTLAMTCVYMLTGLGYFCRPSPPESERGQVKSHHQIFWVRFAQVVLSGLVLFGIGMLPIIEHFYNDSFHQLFTPESELLLAVIIAPSFMAFVGVVAGRSAVTNYFLEQSQTALQKSSRYTDQLAQNLQKSMNQMELALKAGDVGIYELDLDTDIATLRAGAHPMFAVDDCFNIFEHAQTASSVSDPNNFFKALKVEDSDIEYPYILPNGVGAGWARIVTGRHFMEDGRRKGVYIRFDTTQQRAGLEAIRAANEKQRELFAIVGHELRTPVAAMQMILKDASISEAQRVQIFEDIIGNLLSILDDMRIVVAPERAIEAREIVSNPVSVSKRALTPLNHLLIENGFEVEFRYSEHLNQNYYYREQALRQLITNLVKNAAIHSEGSRIWVQLSCDRAITDQKIGASVVTLTVEDNGKGIPHEDLERVFSAFGRGTTSASGTGLGLFIADELGRALGGSLRYETRTGGGSCFSIEFPLSITDKQQDLQVVSRQALDGMRILVVEDDAMLRMLTEKSLSKVGAQVSLAADGLMALEEFDQSSFDLVLTDLMMPTMDGKALIQALRAKGETLPIIAVTAAVIGKETEELLVAGANAVISKPINIEKLLSALANAQNTRVA